MLLIFVHLKYRMSCFKPKKHCVWFILLYYV